MKIEFKLQVLLVAWFLLFFAACATTTISVPAQHQTRQIGFINFSNWPSGDWYTLDKMKYDWNPRLKNGDEAIDFKGIYQHRAIVVENQAFGGHALRVFLPKGKFSPLETGAQIFGDIGGKEEVYFGVSIYLPPDFECGKEIKIPPGIYGGWKFATGGIKPDGIKVGPSIRTVLQNCAAKSYVYHLNQKGNNGDGGKYRNPVNGDKFSWIFPDDRPVVITRGVKHEIMFYARMNTPGEKDGIHKVWYDGVPVLSLDNLEFRKVPTLKFDTVGAEIFRGGNDQSYATPSDNTLDVSDFRVLVK
ncbi:MAG: polysaccharide lyase [Candidatus Falkowbacteria bacterium]